MGNRKLTKSKKSRKSKGRGGQSRKNHTQVGGNYLEYMLRLRNGGVKFNGLYTQNTITELKKLHTNNKKQLNSNVATFIESNNDSIGTPNKKNTLFINNVNKNLIIYYLSDSWYIKDFSSTDDFSYTASPNIEEQNGKETINPLPPPSNRWVPATRRTPSPRTRRATPTPPPAPARTPSEIAELRAQSRNRPTPPLPSPTVGEAVNLRTTSVRM